MHHTPDSFTNVRRHDDLRIPVADETVTATRFEPTGTDGPHPALLMYVPYPRDDIITYGAYNPLLLYLAEQGYEVVVADMVGTGGSTGFLEQLFTRREGREPAAIVKWLADQAWTTGRIGMLGKSYGGITALDAAAQRPDSLEAIVPIHTPYQGVRNAYTHGGAFELLNIGMNWLTLMQALEVKPPSWRDESGQWAEAWKSRLERVRNRDPFLFQFLDHDAGDEYWSDKNIPVGNIQTPTFAISGWRDSYTQDTLEYIDAIDAPTRLIIGPWRHTMPHRGRESAIDFRRQVTAWFDYFLKDEDTDVLDWPEVRYWTERDGGRNVDGGVWRGRDMWPSVNDSSNSISFALSSNGLVNQEAFDGDGIEYTHTFDHTVGYSAVDPPTATLAHVNTNLDDVRSLTFETGRLDAPLEFTGTGQATLRITPTVEDHLVVVRVTDVAPGGAATPVTHGILRLGHREGTGNQIPTPATPGKEYNLRVPLRPRSHVFEANHRIRVAISASYFPLVLPLRHQGEMTIQSTPAAPSRVAFPGGELSTAEFDDSITMATPDKDHPVSSTSVQGSSDIWEVTRVRNSDEVRMRKNVEYGINVPHVKDVQRKESYTATVIPDDPTTAVAKSKHELGISYETERVRVVASNRIGVDLVEVTTQVFIDDQAVFDETWMQ